MATDDSKTPRYYYYDNGKLTLLSVNGEDLSSNVETKIEKILNLYYKHTNIEDMIRELEAFIFGAIFQPDKSN